MRDMGRFSRYSIIKIVKIFKKKVNLKYFQIFIE